MIGRRHFLSTAALNAGTLFAASGLALATVQIERRFIFIMQRGAADGLDIVRPTGDPAFAALRGSLIGDAAAGTKLDAMFTLHPALDEIGRLYGQDQALFVHAVASPYRGRSHFDGQTVLETGCTEPGVARDGWMNRLVAMLPRSAGKAIAIAPTVPAALRGAIRVASFDPFPPKTKGIAGDLGAQQDFTSLGQLTASFLAKPNGPRIAMLETFGWDTHNGQKHRLAHQLKNLDALVAALKNGLGSAWATTTILIATEFGRTAAMNGTGGTDHGTASVAILAGGAVKGGRVIADWPGLAVVNLYEQRDLRPTRALDTVIAGAMAESLVLDPQCVSRCLFAQATGERPLTGLLCV